MNQRNEPDIAPESIEPTTPILDLRGSHAGQQIRGALQYDARAVLDANPLVLPLPRDRTVVVYGGDDETVRRVVAKLHTAGYSGAIVLRGGIDAWTASGLPLEEITEEQPVPGEPGSGMQRL